MSKVKYKTYLSSKSVRHTAQLLRNYQKRLEKQIEQFCEELAKEGETVIRAVLSEHVETGETIGSVQLVTEGSGQYGYYKAKVQVTSDAILFLEFGSGLIGQGTAPHAGEFGMGSGTFPSEVPIQDPQGRYENWANPNGWHYYDGSGKLRNSHGMVASYPMLQGGRAMEEKLESIARKVFG